MVTTMLSPTSGSIQIGESPLSILHINGAVVIRPRGTDNTPRNVEHLTDRELQVLSLVAEGFSNKGDRLSSADM